MGMLKSMPLRVSSRMMLSTILAVACLFQASAQDTAGHNMTDQVPAAMHGQWRGVIEVQDGVYLSLGLNISAAGITLDSPNQGMFERAPTEFTVTERAVTFIDQGLGARYEGELEDGVLAGTFHQARALPLRMYRLTEHDQQRLAFEGTYQGDLQVNAQTALPLRLNIAVLHAEDAHGPYLATLDSPAQQAFGLPVENLQASDEQLSFESAMISATYQGQGSDGRYEGTFIQGMPYPLTLQKVSDDKPLVDISKPDAGEQGGAMATLKRNAQGEIDIEQSFFQGHDQHSQYEIGSVTKTMVAFLLAKLAEDSVVNEDDAVNQWFAEADESITLASLATHHSGLPRLPANLFDGANAQDPYAHFSEQDLRDALSRTTLKVQDYEYSNYGFGLLAEALGKAAQQSFAELLDSQLFTPLGMDNSYVAMTDTDAGEHFIQGHDSLGQAAGAWHFQALAGAGAVVSDLADMQAYVAFMMNLAADDQALAQRLLKVRYPIMECCEQALGWVLQEDPQGRMTVWHNGQTGGYSAFVGFYLDGSAGLVLLNAQSADHTAEMLDQLWELASD
ncbi:MAG: beta-lactamase family protein [Idiomarina sp.]|nr:beta-lactamase family protein [Idiomarina sp.]